MDARGGHGNICRGHLPNICQNAREPLVFLLQLKLIAGLCFAELAQFEVKPVDGFGLKNHFNPPVSNR
ncbi:hypothetical protein D3C80_2080850 [compost metagenome]